MCVVTFDWEENNAKEKFKTFEKKKSLSWAVVEVTEQCNFNCIWCYANANSNIKKQFMPRKDIIKLIDILADSGIKQITFSGGEPTTYPYITDAIEFAYDHGLIVHMNTNGFLLTKKFAKELHKAGLSQVQINIDSLDPDNHDITRGRKGSFKRAVLALKNAKEVGMTSVSQTVLTKKNENDIIDIFKFARNQGIQRCRVWDMTPSEGRAEDNMRLMPSNYILTLLKLTEFAYETNAQNVESGDPLFPLDYKLPLSVSGGEYCAAAAGMFTTISCRGEVYYCATLRKPLYNIWRDLDGYLLKEYHKMRVEEHLQLYQNHEVCGNCKFSKTCNGGCLTRRKFSKNNIDYWCPRLTEFEYLTSAIRETKSIQDEIADIIC